MAGSLSIAAAFVFMLVVAMITANPVHNEEKLMSNQDPGKAIKYFWNEEIGKGWSGHAINLWNDRGTEEEQNKKFNTHTMRDDNKDGDKEKEENDGDRMGEKDKTMNLWNKENIR